VAVASVVATDSAPAWVTSGEVVPAVAAQPTTKIDTTIVKIMRVFVYFMISYSSINIKFVASIVSGHLYIAPTRAAIPNL
jgi:hypothetical protein